MSLLRRRKVEAMEPGVLAGTARIDPRTKNLLARLEPGEIAVIDHEDIDRIAAEGLVSRKPRAIINAARSITGRYPTLGPLLLCSAGIPVIDEVGSRVMKIQDGARLLLEEGRIFKTNGAAREEVARGHVLTLDDVEKRLDEAKQSIAVELERFAENTMSYIRDERDVLLEAARLPEIETEINGRHVLVVVRGHGYKEDLAALGAYIREVRPLFIAVDGGADALIDVGLKPDIIIGDMDSVTTEALLCGAELVVHAYPNGEAPGLERVEALGARSLVFQAPGTSEDIAMLLAFEHGAELIVAVGTHANLVEFMDKGRKGMASTFLTRLRVGPILVDAKGVGRLYGGRVRRRDLVMLVGAAFFGITASVGFSPALRLQLRLWWIELRDVWFDITRALF